MHDELRARHRQRQGAILFLLLLGPAPIALALFVLGQSAGTALALAATGALVVSMLLLYARQRRDARAAGLPVLPLGDVVEMLLVVGGVAGGTFLLPSPATARYGLGCLAVAAIVVYEMGFRRRRRLEDPDEVSVVLVLGLMAVLIALGGAFVL